MSSARTAFTIAALLVAPSSALAATVDISPSASVEGFRAEISTGRESELLFWDEPDRFATTPRGAGSSGERVVRNRGLTTSVFPGAGSIERRGFAAEPDGFTPLDILSPSAETLLAQARAGRTTLTTARVGARATLRGSVRLGANDCAGFRGGVATIDLDARTLIPLRIVTRRSGAATETIRLTNLRLNPTFGPGAFRALRPRGEVFRNDQGFRRTGPAVAAANLPYAPELPSVLPAGFVRAVTGWAPLSAITGPEGSVPARPSLFAAVYARGWERVDVTQRRSLGRDWPDDPFGSECRPLTNEAVSVGGIAATYAFGPETRPHLYWRDGAVLHTVSGPFPAGELVAIAESFVP